MSENKLLACPFCGSGSVSTEGHNCYCCDCYARGPNVPGPVPDTDEAFRRWNRRPKYEMSTLQDICIALGWQGGTIHQVLDEIKRLKKEAQDAGK